jgi:hypothetical protein
MTFLHLWAAWFLAGVPLIVLLYFMRLKRRALPVSTLMFWQRIVNQSGRRSFFQRLRHLLSLLLNLLIFTLLIAALARPLLERSIQNGAGTVLILDARARMNAVEHDGQTRFAKALAMARGHAHQISGQHQLALIIVGARPTVAVPFTSDEKPLLDALNSARPTEATDDLNAALTLADSLLASRKGENHIVLISDREPKAPSLHSHLITQSIATPLDNLAITRFATRPLPASPETSELLLEIQNFGRATASTDVELSYDGRLLEVKPFTLAPGERRLEFFTSVPRPTRSARGWLKARITTPDALAFDNVAYATLPTTRTARVLLVSRGNAFLEKFLSVDASVKFQLITPEAWQPSLAPKFEAVIFDNTLPAEFNLTSTQGNFLFLKSTPFAAATPLEQPLVTDVDAAHPATRNVSLQNVTILHAAALTLPEPHDGWTFSAPLRSFDHALLVTGERKQQRIAALAFDVLESDLPLRVAFPLLMNNTLHWLAGEQSAGQQSAQSGETITLTEGQRITANPVTSENEPVSKPDIAHFLQPMHNGYYALSDGDTMRWIAVNTFSADESDLRASGGNTPTSPPSVALASFSNWPFWRWLAFAAFALLVAEWWLFHRRKTE